MSTASNQHGQTSESGTPRDGVVPSGCRVRTGARLHFGLLSVNNPACPAFGGVGLMVEEPGGEIEVVRTSESHIAASAELTPRLADWLERLRRSDERIAKQPLRVRALEELPGHAGYGSGTQTSLALAEAVRRVCGCETGSPWDVARSLGRAKRSAIGVAGYFQGGLLVDAGHRPGEAVGEIVARETLPEEWRVLLVEAPRREGLSGAAEGTAFDRLPPMPGSTTDRLWELIRHEMLPAINQTDCRRFVCALVEYGRRVGDYFSGEQGGTFAASSIARADTLLRGAGWPGLAQSSWGPTAVTIAPNLAQAQAWADLLVRESPQGEIRIRIVRPLATGRTLTEFKTGEL